MRLERLEINGFKSFSDRSELAFDKGVTAIVGPNGCGKSNVADAITWVMGEQSAKSLRGERMEDVIFNGSDARKPTAAAEVRLRFSGVVKTLSGPAFEHGSNGSSNGTGHHHANGNGSLHHHLSAHDNGHTGNGHGAAVPDGAPAGSLPGSLEGDAGDTLIRSVAREVEVTRRLYRSGDSEYLIDGQVCRLRDVHDLLMDTGLGAKAYAIIEQGKIGLILSSRPTDRRQLIEEAAGITKYKSRRRAAALKLEAALQNLTRVDDIVFEVEKQRGALKRQAARARRYQRLRDELRRWEKVLFARKHRQLAETIEAGRDRLNDARGRESAAAARVVDIEAELGRLRAALAEAESGAMAAREQAHARELAINRQQQQIAFDREQVRSLESRSAAMATELQGLDARGEPALREVQERRQAARAAASEREAAGQVLVREADAYASAHAEIEGLEADVEGARSEVFSAINSATALRHALAHAGSARDRVAEALTKLDVEIQDVRIEAERVEADCAAAADRLRQTREAVDANRISRSARESELASARIEHEWRARTVRIREQELASLEGRLESLEALEAARAGYGDGARAVLAQANGKVCQQGAVADYLEVDAGYERAVEACLGDLLQHVVVERAEHAADGLRLLRDESAGRCGFVVTAQGEAPAGASAVIDGSLAAAGLVPLSAIVRVHGPFAGAIRRAIGDAWIAQAYDAARAASRDQPLPVATLEGDVFRGPHIVSGGGRDDARGILETKREIKELRRRIEIDRDDLRRLIDETTHLEGVIAQASSAAAALQAEHHALDKAMAAHDGQLQRAAEDLGRLAQKGEQLVRERQQAVAERDALDARRDEALQAIARLEQEQRAADERFSAAQHRLFGAREAAEELSLRAADAKAAHAALLERAAALEGDVRRLEDAAAELAERATGLRAELDEVRRRIEALTSAVADGEARLDGDVVALHAGQAEVRRTDEILATLRARADQQDAVVKAARADLESIRAVVAEYDIARATAESDLAHLASACFDAVQATLDEVTADLDRLEREGIATPDVVLVAADDPEDDDAAEGDDAAAEPDATQLTLGAEEAIAALRARIDRLGPVNMMAIEQFEDLETRHAFLTTQRADLVESISQTTEAIKRIDETTRQRFAEAFGAINQNFQRTFATLFGGGRAGLTLLDQDDPLESGIEIIAQPPGKRLQSVQLLSGGEKALTAIALMFGLFEYKPSPFCLLDEIDAPLDDANIGRFVEMLRGMQRHTQFILITHNRKTMEIADRLYGVTMEEPGVSKLISVNMN